MSTSFHAQQVSPGNLVDNLGNTDYSLPDLVDRKLQRFDAETVDSAFKISLQIKKVISHLNELMNERFAGIDAIRIFESPANRSKERSLETFAKIVEIRRRRSELNEELKGMGGKAPIRVTASRFASAYEIAVSEIAADKKECSATKAIAGYFCIKSREGLDFDKDILQNPESAGIVLRYCLANLKAYQSLEEIQAKDFSPAELKGMCLNLAARGLGIAAILQSAFPVIFEGEVGELRLAKLLVEPEPFSNAETRDERALRKESIETLKNVMIECGLMPRNPTLLLNLYIERLTPRKIAEVSDWRGAFNKVAPGFLNKYDFTSPFSFFAGMYPEMFGWDRCDQITPACFKSKGMWQGAAGTKLFACLTAAAIDKQYVAKHKGEYYVGPQIPYLSDRFDWFVGCFRWNEFFARELLADGYKAVLGSKPAKIYDLLHL